MDSAPRIWFHTRATEGKMSSYDFLDFRGKAVLVTGAATGIGRAVAVGFASPGAMVAIGDINEEAARETLELVRRAGSEVLFVRTNVSVESDVEKLVAATVERFGRLDRRAGFDSIQSCSIANVSIAEMRDRIRFAITGAILAFPLNELPNVASL
jgi:NAD(P)-dependent dehydrogenase (short-subunit alcohol dehydrogenase family)